MSLEEQLLDAMIDLQEEASYDTIRKMLEEGADPKKIIETLRKGVEVVGQKFVKKEYFLTELVMAGEIFQQSAKILESALNKEHAANNYKATVVVGTVKGDVHDIGKNIFITLLKSSGLEVYDIGVDVPPEAFVEKVKETKAQIVGYSGLLTVALESMNKTTNMLKEAGLRDRLKIIIGGLPVDELWMKEAGADGFTDNAFEGLKIVTKWIEEGLS
jgi:methylmalonyl-CoA mutase cobalamin-binding domain/chain